MTDITHSVKKMHHGGSTESITSIRNLNERQLNNIVHCTWNNDIKSVNLPFNHMYKHR